MAKKQINKIYMGKKLSKKERARLAQQNAENDEVMKWFFIYIVIILVVSAIIWIIL